MDSRRRPPVQTYRKVSAETWDLARAAYVGGQSARSVCERFGLGEANLRKKARLEGWTKRDWADTRGVIDGGVMSASTSAQVLALPEDGDLMATVLRRAREALTAGRGSEATSLIKAARDYVIVSQDVERAREGVAAILPPQAGLTPEHTTLLSETLIQTRLGHLWAPQTREDDLAQIQAIWASVPADEREARFPGMDAYITGLGGPGHR